MTPEIKHRIEQIRNGEVPKGYKRTRAGIMPCDWCTQKEYKAKDIFYSVSNKNHNGDYEVLSATQDRGVIPRSQVDIDIKYDDANIGGYKMVDKGDFVISLRSFQGGIEYSEYTGLVSPAYTVLKPRVSICDGYYKSYFKTNDFISRLNKGTYGIRDGKQVGFKDFGEMTIHFPPLPEQQRIAKILSAQDKVIECYEKKIEQLKQMKKYYLQNMFPKHGETVPKIRFKGFTEPWEQRRISEILSEKLTNGVINFQSTKETDVRHINVIDMYTPDKIHTDELSYSAHDDLVVKKCNVKYGDIFLTRSSLKPEGIAKPNVLLSFGRFVFDDHLIKLKIDNKKYDPYFVKICLESHQLKKQFIMRSKTTAFTTIGQNDIAKCNGFFPDISEQRQIASLFSSIDELITLHQRKLEEEKKKKKALQQLLLTGIVRTN